MEIVFALLVVALLIVLPLVFVLVMLGGLIDAIRRAFRKDEPRAPGAMPESPADKTTTPDGNRENPARP
jgi:hypothetical protein